MACACDEIKSLYLEILDNHIYTKTNDPVFHPASAAFYETAFAAYHGAKEAFQDSKQESPMNPKEARQKTYDALEKIKSILVSMVESNKDIGTDNVLRGLVDKISFDCGNARALLDGADSTVDANVSNVSEETEDEMSEDEWQEWYSYKTSDPLSEDNEEDEEDEKK